jgi:hypothetical protein
MLAGNGARGVVSVNVTYQTVSRTEAIDPPKECTSQKQRRTGQVMPRSLDAFPPRIACFSALLKPGVSRI